MFAVGDDDLGRAPQAGKRIGQRPHDVGCHRA